MSQRLATNTEDFCGYQWLAAIPCDTNATKSARFGASACEAERRIKAVFMSQRLQQIGSGQTLTEN
jgi:hypothetical protein